MLQLNEQEQIALKEIISSDLFKKAKDIVLERLDGPIFNLMASEQSMALAQEKGARNAFRQLGLLTEPRPERQQLSTKKLTRV